MIYFYFYLYIKELYIKIYNSVKMIPPYWMTIFPLSYIFVKSIKQNIDKNAKRKSDIVHLNMLYNHHLECLQQKGFPRYIKIDDKNLYNENKYEVILQNKDIKELEICKNTYFNFISAYRKYKNNIF